MQELIPRTVRYMGQCVMYTWGISTKEVVPMNENRQTTTSTPSQQLVGALYLLTLLAALIRILL